MRIRWKFLLLSFLLVSACFHGLQPVEAQAGQAQVQAVLFYSPNCQHCRAVIDHELPAWSEKYGEQLDVMVVDVTGPRGAALFGSAAARFEIPADGQVVPMLVMGDTVLLGSEQIAAEAPGLIEAYLAQGGRAWPDIPGLQDMLESRAYFSTPGAAAISPAGAPEEALAGLQERWQQDRVGNSLAVLVLAGMLLSVVAVLRRLLAPGGGPDARSNWIPVLCLAGMIVAGYLAYVEITQVKGVCGPVGDCHAVQSSRYARLFGILPLGGLGLAGYLGMLAAWWLSRRLERSGRRRRAGQAAWALFGLALGGVLVSIYLTFLEPFVIGATCAWCLASAVLMTALLWAAGREAGSFSGLPGGRSGPSR